MRTPLCSHLGVPCKPPEAPRSEIAETPEIGRLIKKIVK